MSCNPKTLVPGAYWYLVPGKEPVICEKREGEAFVRFTNGGRQAWARDGESFDGPLAVPVAAGINSTQYQEPKEGTMVFENMKKELSELVGLVRQSERYCAAVDSKPDLATSESHALEVQREHRIAELSARYGITA